MREMQWQCYNKHQLEVSYMKQEETLVYRYGVESQPRPEETPLIYFAADMPVDGFEGDRDEFIGPYRSEEEPIGVWEKELGNSLLKGGDPCFALKLTVDLKAGEEKEIHIFLGAEKGKEEIRQTLAKLRRKGYVQVSVSGAGSGNSAHGKLL